MRTTQHPQRWEQALNGVPQWATVVEWSNTGGRDEWTPTDFVSGTVTADANSQIRWHADLQIRDDRVGVDGINPFTTRFRVRHGIQWSAAELDRELLGMGVYRVAAVSRSSQDPSLLTVSGDSFEQYVIKARLVTPWKAPKDDAAGRLDRLIRYVLPDATIFWDGVNSRILPSTTIDRDRWEAIDGSSGSASIARALSARVYCSGDGVFVVRPVPSVDATPVWEASIGPGGLLINSTEELSNDGVYNQVVVTGETTEDVTPPVGPGIAQDEDPFSPTYIRRSPDEGGFGRCPRFYSSPLLTSISQARSTAQSMLASTLGLRQQVTFDSLHDPRKEPGDVGTVTNPDGSASRVILNSVTYDLLGGPLQCETRTTRTVPGQQTDDPEIDEGDTA